MLIGYARRVHPNTFVLNIADGVFRHLICGQKRRESVPALNGDRVRWDALTAVFQADANGQGLIAM